MPFEPYQGYLLERPTEFGGGMVTAPGRLVPDLLARGYRLAESSPAIAACVPEPVVPVASKRRRKSRVPAP